MTNEIVHTSDEINLRELFSAIWQDKLLIAAITSFFTVAVFVYALSLPDIYKSEALLAPVNDESGLKIPGQLGGLAAMAGLNLGGLGGKTNNTNLAMEIIQSRDFLGKFIKKHNLSVPLMAATAWDYRGNSLVIDPEIYNSEAKLWVRKVKSPFTAEPSLLELNEAFSKLIDISQDKTTGMITLGVEFFSPHIAKQIIDDLVKDINEDIRSRDLLKAKRSITYLNTQLENTSNFELRTMLYSLIEEQTKVVTLAHAQVDYVFTVIDPAYIAQRKSSPNRVMIVIMGMLFGFMFSLLVSICIRKKS